MEKMLGSPSPTELTPALFIDDVETKGPRYMQKEGRTALA